MKEDNLIAVWVNALQFLEVDEPWATACDRPATSETVLEFMCTPGLDAGLESLLSRYQEISVEKHRLFAAPHEERILEKLVWPLRHAKASYIVGNHLGTISLCGMVAEMIAILLTEISGFTINDQPMTRANQGALFGGRFEKLGQQRRVQILHAFKIIDDEIKDAFDLIREKRNKYLHLWSHDHNRIRSDAVEVYCAAVSIVVNVLGQDIREGKILLNPALMKYLERSGVYEPEDDQTASEKNAQDEDTP